MHSVVELQRSEAEEIARLPGWVLIFGRRKVGKTYILERFLKHDVYVVVRRDGVIIADGLGVGRIEGPDRLADAIGPRLEQGATVVVDEFQRLPDSFLDEIATYHPDGRLILSGSSLRVVNSVLGSRSPMLGLAYPYRVGLVRPVDLLRSLSAWDPAAAVSYAAYLREPWLVPLLEGPGDLERTIHDIIPPLRFAVPALVGEVFVESERTLTQTYEAILRGLGAGLWRPGDLAHLLQNTGVIGKEGSNFLRSYLKNLETMGLVQQLPVFRKRKWAVYRLTSPLLETYYYLADRHRIDERDCPLRVMAPNLKRMVHQAVERFIGELFVQLEEGQLEHSFDPELDIIVTRGREREPIVVGEVKWSKYDGRDIDRFMEKVKDLDCRKVFVVKKRTSSVDARGLEVLDAKDLVALAKKNHA